MIFQKKENREKMGVNVKCPNCVSNKVQLLKKIKKFFQFFATFWHLKKY